MDNSVPLSVEELEQIVSTAAQSLYVKWAEEGRFTEEEMTQYASYAADDTFFIVNAYMTAFNDLVATKSRSGLIVPDTEPLFDVTSYGK